MDPAGSQFERTRLAWRRTILALLVVGGLGAVDMSTSGYPLEAAIVTLLTACAVAPAVDRLRRLRREVRVPTWQPVILTAAVCLMALTVFVKR